VIPGAPAARVPECPNLARALHPLHAPPAGAGWNRVEIADLLLPVHPLVEAAVLVGLVPRADGSTVLLTRRSAGMRQHGGQVSFPGGRVEASDSDGVAAAVRETGEEVGLDPDAITPLGLLDPLVTVSGFRILPVVALVDAGYVARPDPREVDEVFEVPLRFLLDPVNLAIHSYLYRGLPRDVLEFRYPAQRIWGATASILLNLRERLEQCDVR